jgi:hypothetical protein
MIQRHGRQPSSTGIHVNSEIMCSNVVEVFVGDKIARGSTLSDFSSPEKKRNKAVSQATLS